MSLFFMLKKKRRWFLPTPKFIEPKSEDLSGQRVCAGLFDKVNKMIFSLNIGLIQFAEPIVCMSA